jgi:hypothetical protein
MKKCAPLSACYSRPLALFTVAAIVLIGFASAARAYDVTDTLEVRGLYRMESYFRLPDTRLTVFNPTTETFHKIDSDVLMSQRNELRLDIEWTPHTHQWAEWAPPVKVVVQLRPFYDSDWLISTSGGQGKFQHQLTPFWQNNVQGNAALRDNVDPLFREEYADITPPHFFFRLGRQIIAWGKSDGVYMLDVLNPFNLRNPTIFEEENIKIPIYAANLNWQPTPTSNLQLLWIPQYYHHYWPGLRLGTNNEPIESNYHDWTYNIVGFFNNFYNGAFGFKVPVFQHIPSSRANNWIGGARWSDSRWGLNYTLNYLYTYTQSLIDFPNTGSFNTVTAVNRQPHRMQVAGFSADYDFEFGNKWIDGTVWRVESSETIGDEYYQGLVGNPRYTSHWGMLMGVDRTVLGDYLERPVFASFQYWHDMVTNQARCSVAACGAQPGDYQDLGFAGSSSGMRGVYKSLVTLFTEKTWLDGDTVITDFFALYDIQFHDWWIRPKITYKYDDNTTVALGFNIFAGSKQTPFGEFTHDTNAFIELRRLLF